MLASSDDLTSKFELGQGCCDYCVGGIALNRACLRIEAFAHAGHEASEFRRGRAIGAVGREVLHASGALVTQGPGSDDGTARACF